jgi:hypothetical protein
MVVQGSAWRGGFLDVTERDACVEGGHGVGVPDLAGVAG